MNMNYAEAVRMVGGAPVILVPGSMSSPIAEAEYDKLAENFMNFVNGLILTGGGDFVDNFDHKPANFPEILKMMDKARDLWEMALLKAAIASKKPIFGICRGLQIMNIFFGGTLFHDIDEEVPNPLEHKQKTPRDQTSHLVKLTKNSRIASIIGSSELEVNSGHHQAAKDPGEGFVVTGWAPDGVIEAMEHTDLPFAIAVQWHPEGLAIVRKTEELLFSALVEAARETV
jgi:putative glutamine amidotransferase